MYSLIDIGLSSLFAIALTVVYFLYEKILTIRAFSFISVRSYVLDSVNGIVFGMFTLLFKIILIAIDKNFNAPLFFIITIVLLVVKNLNVALLSMFPPLIFYFIRYDVLVIAELLIGTLSMIIFVYLLFNYFTRKNIANISVFLSSVIFSIISIIVIIYGFKIPINRYVLESSIFIPFMLLISYYPLRTAIKFSISANILFESVNYVLSSYVRHSLSSNAIGNNIAENKISKAIFGIFKIRFIDNISSATAEEIRETILLKFEKLVKDSTLFAGNNEYGFFIPIRSKINIRESLDGNYLLKRKPEDAFSKLESIIEKLNGWYRTVDDKIIFASVRAGACIYGVQSNSINMLEEYSRFALENIVWDTQQLVRVYDNKKYRARLIDRTELARMDNNINLNNFQNTFIPIIDLKNKISPFNYVLVKNNSEYNITESVDELVRMNSWKITFDRYFASEAINKILESSTKFFIEYSPFIIQDDFNISEFKLRINRMGANLKNIIWVLSGIDIENKKKVNKIKSLKSNNIRIAIKNFDSLDINELLEIDPEFLIVNNNEYNGSDHNIPTVNPFISSESEFNSAIKSNVDYIGGALFQNNSFVEKFNKQSKIYLETLIENSKGSD